MPLTDITRLSDDATVWIFGIAPAATMTASMLREVDEFLDGWAAHNVPVLAARELREGRFLVVAAEKDAGTSGCSIDRLFGLVRHLEQQLGVSMLDPNRLFYRDAKGVIADTPRKEFGEVAGPETIVFDPTVPTLGDIRTGRWEKPAGESWHASLLAKSA